MPSEAPAERLVSASLMLRPLDVGDTKELAIRKIGGKHHQWADQTVFFLCFFVFWGSKWVSKLWKNVDINYYLYRESDRYSESCELTWFWISQAESSCPRYGRSTIDNLKTYQVCVHKDCQHLHRFFLNVSYVSWCLQKVAQFWNNLLKTNSLPLKMGHSQRRKGLPCTSSLTQLSGALSCMFCMVNGWPLWCVWKCYVTRRCMFLAPCAWSSMPWFFSDIRTPNFFRLQPDFGPVNVSVLVKVRQTDKLKLVVSSSKTSKLLEFTAASRLEAELYIFKV